MPNTACCPRAARGAGSAGTTSWMCQRHRGGLSQLWVLGISRARLGIHLVFEFKRSRHGTVWQDFRFSRLSESPWGAPGAGSTGRLAPGCLCLSSPASGIWGAHISGNCNCLGPRWLARSTAGHTRHRRTHTGLVTRTAAGPGGNHLPAPPPSYIPFYCRAIVEGAGQ